MSNVIRKAGISLTLCLIVSAVAAQDTSPESGRETVRRLFEASGLEVGSQFPDVEINDAEGQPFRTGSLRGSHVVLVTGCLT